MGHNAEARKHRGGGSLNGLAAIVLVNGRQPEPDTLARAEEMSIPIISTPMQAFEAIGILHSLGIHGRRQV